MAFTGCTHKLILTDDDIAEMNIKGTQYATYMIESNFQQLEDHLTSKMAKSVKIEEIETFYLDAISNLGDFEKIEKVESKIVNNNIVCTVNTRYEKNGVIVSMILTSKGEISGLWISYYPIELPLVENDIFKEISISYDIDGVDISGILTLPHEYDETLAVLVQGSGQSNMNEGIGKEGNVPFLDIAHGLANEGIASVRFNKRYFQYPETAKEDITIFDEVINDVLHIIDNSLNIEGATFTDVSLIGHSLGGMIAPYVASQNQHVSSIVSLAGTLRPLEDVMYDQLLDSYKVNTIFSEKEKETALKSAADEIAEIKKLEVGVDGLNYLGISSHYFASLNQLNTQEIAPTLDTRYLILQGSEDFQVYAKTDFELWKTELENHPDSTFILYEGLNHLFMQSSGKTGITEYDNKQTVNNKVITDIAEFILK